jgi:hypothetical protein
MVAALLHQRGTKAAAAHAAGRREVAEELGLDRSGGRVLAVDWVPLARRIAACLNAAATGTVAALENGSLAEVRLE